MLNNESIPVAVLHRHLRPNLHRFHPIHNPLSNAIGEAIHRHTPALHPPTVVCSSERCWAYIPCESGIIEFEAALPAPAVETLRDFDAGEPYVERDFTLTFKRTEKRHE